RTSGGISLFWTVEFSSPHFVEACPAIMRGYFLCLFLVDGLPFIPELALWIWIYLADFLQHLIGELACAFQRPGDLRGEEVNLSSDRRQDRIDGGAPCLLKFLVHFLTL